MGYGCCFYIVFDKRMVIKNMTIDNYLNKAHRMRRAIGNYEAYQDVKQIDWIFKDVKQRSRMEQRYFLNMSRENRKRYNPLIKDQTENELRIYNCAYESLLDLNKKSLWQMIKGYWRVR